MTFARPELLGLAPVAALLLLAAILAQWRRARKLERLYGGPVAARRLTGRRLGGFPASRVALQLSGAVALVLAAAGVERDSGDPLPPTTPVDLIVALDVSQSMSGGDVAPSRAERARDVVRRLLEEDVADRIALTLFADWSYGLVPLTHDGDVIRFFTPVISPDRVAPRDQGTALASAVSHAATTWRSRERSEAVPIVLLVSDGETHGGEAAALDSVSAIAGTGVRFWTAGVGTPRGAPLFVPGSDGAPLLDGSGAPVVATYDPELLREVAARGGGGFHDVSDDAGVDALVAELRSVGGEAAVPPTELPDPTVWLVLLGFALLAADAALDAGALQRLARRLSPRDREAAP